MCKQHSSESASPKNSPKKSPNKSPKNSPKNAPKAPASPPITDFMVNEFLDHAKRGDFHRALDMLEKYPALVNRTTPGRWSALHQAAFHGNVTVVTILVAYSADKNALDNAGQRPIDVVKKNASHSLRLALTPSITGSASSSSQAGSSTGTSFSSAGLPVAHGTIQALDLTGSKVTFRATSVPAKFGQYEFRHRMYFSKAARVASSQRKSGPTLLVTESDWRVLRDEKVTHAGAFGEDSESVGAIVDSMPDMSWVAVWKFPSDLNRLPGFTPITGTKLPVGTYAFMLDTWWSKSKSVPSFSEMPLNASATKMRLDYSSGPPLHTLRHQNQEVAMIGHDYFIADHWHNGPIDAILPMLDSFKSLGILVVPCYLQHHAFVFYGWWTGSAFKFMTPLMIALLMSQGSYAEKIVQLLKQAARPEKRDLIDAWRTRAIQAWSDGNTVSVSTVPQTPTSIWVVSYNLSWATAKEVVAGSERMFVRDKCKPQLKRGICRSSAIDSILRMSNLPKLVGFQEYVPWNERERDVLMERGLHALSVDPDHKLSPTAKVSDVVGAHAVAYMGLSQKDCYYSSVMTMWDAEILGKMKNMTCIDVGSHPDDARPVLLILTESRTLLVNAHAPHDSIPDEITRRIDRAIRDWPKPKLVLITGDFNDVQFSWGKGAYIRGLKIHPPKRLVTCCYEPGGFGTKGDEYRLVGDYVMSSSETISTERFTSHGKTTLTIPRVTDDPGRSDHEPIVAHVKLPESLYEAHVPQNAVESGSEAITVLGYNILTSTPDGRLDRLSMFEKDLVASGKYRYWSLRRNNVAAALRGVHVAGLCECTDHMLEYLLEQNRHLSFVAHALKSDEYDGSAILVDRTRIEVLGKPYRKTLTTTHNQILLAHLLKDKRSGTPFWFAVLHLKSDGSGPHGGKEDVRVGQAARALKRINALSPKAPTIIVGDLNSDRFLYPRFEAKGIPHVMNVFREFQSVLPVKPTYDHYNRAAFDHILLRGARAVSTTVPDATGPCPNASQGSDHFPVKADVVLEA